MQIRIQTGASDHKEFIESDPLLPCPKCGEVEPHLYYGPEGQGGGAGFWSVRCWHCHQTGPTNYIYDTAYARLQAMQDWNGNEGWRDRVKRLFASQ